MNIRLATSKDAESIFELIRELAIYEKAEHEVMCSAAELRTNLFGPNTKAFAIIAEQDNTVLAYAVYFYNYSTWLGKNGIYLEDVYVKPEYRKQGIGKAIIKYVARSAGKENCGRLEWAVLDWNTPAIEFYESLGARPQDEWITYRLSGKNLLQFASD